MATGLGGGGFPRVKELLAYIKSLGDTVITSGGSKAAQVNLRDALGNEIGVAGGLALKVDVSGDFPDNIQGAVEQANADIDPNNPGHRVKPVKTGSRANAAAPAAVAENQIVDAWFDLNGRAHVAMDDGSHITIGAIADAAVLAGATGTVSAKLRRVSTDVDALLTKLTDLNTLGVAGGVGIKQDIVRIAGTAPSTAGKLDVKSADGDNAGLGATTDVSVIAGATGSVSAKMRRLSTDLDALLTKVIDLDGLGTTGGAGIKQDIIKIAGTAPSTAGKLDIKIADGDSIALGAIADASVLAGASGSLSAKIRRISTDIDATLTKVTDIDTAVGAAAAALPAKTVVIGLDNAGNTIVAKSDTAGNLKVAVKTPITPYVATGAAALSLTANPAFDFYLQNITVHLNSAPTTAGNLTITLNAVSGAEYNTLLYSLDLAAGAITDIVFQAEHPLLCRNGDTISIAYANADLKTYGARIIVTPA